MITKLSMTESQHRLLLQHLFPQDGFEAVAIALCGRAYHNDIHCLVVRSLDLVPYEDCSVRTPVQVTWPTERLVPLLEVATKHNLALVKIHGHVGMHAFSAVDDASDRALFPSVHAWVDGTGPHASAIMMNDGQVFGRTVSDQGQFTPLDAVSVVGDDLNFYSSRPKDATPIRAFGERIAQSFGEATFQRLQTLRIGVVGCSGTGSPVIEQLARNCVGSLVLVDPDRVEEKNLNRILNTTMRDAETGILKVDVARRSIDAMGLGTKVETYASTLFEREVVRALSTCDVIFGCVDTIDGRHLLNKLASYYLIPYLDLGVKIVADGQGNVDQVAGSVHYLKPGGSSLVSRHTYSMEQVRAAGLQRTQPEEYKKLLEEGYVRGAAVDRPAVIQLNSLIASLAVSELLARLLPYRSDPNGQFAVTRISLAHWFMDREPDGEPCAILSRHVGKGDVEPLLDWPELSAKGD